MGLRRHVRRAHGGQARAVRRRLGQPGPRCPRHGSRLRAWRAARGRLGPGGPALRLPGRAPSLRALHARDGRGDLRRAGGPVPRGRGGAVRQLRPGAHVGRLLRGRLDASHDRCPDHPRRVDHAAAAREHRPPRWRHPRAARPREHPGLDGHPDALRHPARLHPDAAPQREGLQRLGRDERSGQWRVGAAARVLHEPDEGVVRRRGHRGQRLVLWPPAAHRRRPFALRDHDEHGRRPYEGLLRHRPEPRRRIGQRRDAT